MARPRQIHPTPVELEILKVIWAQGSCTVREVMAHLDQDPPRAYTSVMSVMNVMFEKSLLKRKPLGRAFTYTAAQKQEKTLAAMVGDLVERACEGSSSALMAHLLNGAKPTDSDIEQMQDIIQEYKTRKGQ